VEKLGLLPEIPESLYEAARGDRGMFGAALLGYAQSEPAAMRMLPFVLAKTLGPVLGSASLAALWGLLQMVPSSFRQDAARAGFDPGPRLGEQLFQAVLDHPEGLCIAASGVDNNLANLRTEDRRINLFIPELQEWVKGIDAAREEQALRPDPEYPLILMAGRHIDENANTIMRDPAWNTGRGNPCTVAMHPSDAEHLGLADGRMVRVITEAGKVEIALEITETARPGHVVIPHGFGLVYQGREYGVNVNRLTKNTHRDSLAATPLHRYVPCRVEPVHEE
jgi:formylmethanofuran dehydrogenase subunit D